MAKKQRKTKRTTSRNKEANRTPERDEQGWWDRQSERTQHVVCIGLLIVVSFVFFAPIHFSGKSLAQTDTVFFRSMSHAMTEFEEETGEKALWSPNAFGGMPGYMIATPLQVKQIDEVPRLLRYVIWPSSHFIVLLIGAYLLAFRLTRHKWAAVFAACAFGLTTYIPVYLIAGHNSKLLAMAFSPWLIWAFINILRQPGLLHSLLFAAILAVNLRAGHVQITYYVAFLLFVWWIVEGVAEGRKEGLARFLRGTGWLALGTLLGVVMVAQPYLSNFEYKAYTIRGAVPGGAPGGLAWDYAMAWSQGIGELITLAIADAYGGSAAYWGPKGGTGGPHYFGGLVLLLGALALYKVRRKEVAALGIAGFLMVLFSFGEHFPSLNRLMFNYFPMFDSFRVPETWLGIVALVAALLAAYGMAYLLEQATDNRLKTGLKAIGLAVGILVVVLVMKDVFFAFERGGEEQYIANILARENQMNPADPQVTAAVDRYIAQIKGERRGMFQNDAIRTILFLAAAGLLLFLRDKKRIPAFATGIALVALITLDLGGVGRRYLDPDKLSDARSVDDEIPEYDFDRYLVEQREILGGSGHFRVFSLSEGSPVTTARPSYFHESLGGYHGAKLRLYQDYLDHLLVDEQTGLPSENGLDLLNTKYVVARGQLPGARTAYVDEKTGMIVNERNTLPRGFFVGETEVISSSESTWKRIQSAGFDPARTAILPEPYPFQTTPIDSNSVVDVQLEVHTPHEIVWNVETDAPRLFVASEVYYPAGWNAYLDGEQAPIYRVDYLLRGVPVQAGAHTLTMRFEPRSYRIGYWLTLISTILVYGGIAVLWAMRKRSAAQKPVDVQDAEA